MKIYTLLLLMIICRNIYAQEEQTDEVAFNMYDAQGKYTMNHNKAVTYESIIQPNDTTYIARYYKKRGPMIRQGTFSDRDLTIPNGRFVWYDSLGNIDSTGIIIHGQKDGVWWYAKTVNSKDKNGNTIIIKKGIKTVYYNLGTSITKQMYYQDTTENSAIKRNSPKVGGPAFKTDMKQDTINQKPAEYPGGQKEWTNYLGANINFKIGSLIPQYALLKDNKAPVVVAFVIGKDGSVGDVFVINSMGYPFDRAATHAIEQSRKWIPAQQNDHAVTYQQKQKIIFSN